MSTTAGSQCRESYGFLPCSSTLKGSCTLMLFYGYLLFKGAQLIADGSELLLEILDPGLIGGLLLPILGALPDCFIIAMSGLGSSPDVAQTKVAVGIGTLAGSTIMLLTIAWGGSLLIGRCDLRELDGRSIDKQLTRSCDFVNTGVTTDGLTPPNAYIMLASVSLYLIVQAPSLAGQTHNEYTVLAALALASVGLVAYCCYQVVVPELQKRQLLAARARFVKSHSIKTANIMAVQTGRTLFDANGSVDDASLMHIFHMFDTDHNGHIERDELTALVAGMTFGASGFVARDIDVQLYLQQFDIDNSNSITADEFLWGMKQWIEQHGHATLNGSSSGKIEIYCEPSTECLLGKPLLEAALEEKEEEEDDKKQPPTKSQLAIEAIVYLCLGSFSIGLFSGPMVESISTLAERSDIPAFFISFIVTPMVSNASELVSSFAFASKRRQRNISLTFAQVYGAVTMNNTLCLAVFLLLVYLKDIAWDFSAEVTVIFVTVMLVGSLGASRLTFKAWLAFPVLLLYPFSLALVAYLDQVLGWH
eukprot:SM000007S20903  [mRNA]  locus=s7:782807:786568:+ [translate_table: standard]